jgi:hypothetical protein
MTPEQKAAIEAARKRFIDADPLDVAEYEAALLELRRLRTLYSPRRRKAT